MKRKSILGAAIAALLIAIAIYLYGGSTVPAGQPPLQRLTTTGAADFEHEFNAARKEVRVVILLAPT